MAANRETAYKRINHGDFKKTEASRPAFQTSDALPQVVQTPDPSWKIGTGANSHHSAAGLAHIPIDPHAPGRDPMDNYRLAISAVAPRPISLTSTRSRDGSATNLAPFSFFNMVSAEPPMFVLGLTTPLAEPNDTLRNLRETGECVINMVSEGFVEAANAAGVNAPYGKSEWDVSGLTAVYDCKTVECARVREAVVSIEAKVESIREFESRAKPGTMSGSLVVLEASYFWVREGAVNEARTLVDPKV